MRTNMKYIVVLTRRTSLRPIIRKMALINARVVTISAVQLPNRETSLRQDRLEHSGGRLSEEAFVGILVGEDSVQTAMAAIMRTRGALHAELVDLLCGLFGINRPAAKRLPANSLLKQVPSEFFVGGGCSREAARDACQAEGGKNVQQVAIGLA